MTPLPVSYRIMVGVEKLRQTRRRRVWRFSELDAVEFGVCLNSTAFCSEFAPTRRQTRRRRVWRFSELDAVEFGVCLNSTAPSGRFAPI